MIRPQTCPICHKQLSLTGGAASNLFPFCSERCRQVDLFRWAEGKYAIIEPLGPQNVDDLEAELDRLDAGPDDGE